MFKVVGFESDTASLIGDQVNRWMASHPEALLISIAMAGTTTGHDSEFPKEWWGALATFRFPVVPA